MTESEGQLEQSLATIATRQPPGPAPIHDLIASGRRLRVRRRTRLVIAVVAALCLFTAASAGWLVHRHPAASPSTTDQARTYLIDPQIGETFTVANPAQLASLRTPLMGAHRAIDKSAHRKVTLAKDAVVLTGYLTLPTGGGGYTAHHQLVYALTSRAEQWAPFSPPSPAPGYPPITEPPDLCHMHSWEFFDAVTGYNIDGTYSQTGPEG